MESQQMSREIKIPNQITKQISMLCVQVNEDPTKVKYRIALLMKDHKGNQYSFKSDKEYNFDESGQAYFDLDTCETANRNDP